MKMFLRVLAFLFFILSGVSFAQDVVTQDISGDTITLDVKDMEISDVIRMIADQSKMNIITSRNVKGLVTINLEAISVEKALDAILKVNNCGYVKEGEIIQVYTLPELNQKEQFSQTVTRVFRLKHVKAADLKNSLASLKSGRGRMEVEPRTNSIVVTDIEESMRAIESAVEEMDKKMDTRVYQLSYAKAVDLQKNLSSVIPAAEGDFLVDERTNSLVVSASPLLLDKIDALIENWDKQIPQVLIEAKIMQVTLDKSRFLGVDWQVQNPSKHTMTLGVTNLPLPTGVSTLDAFKIGVLGTDDYQVTLKALESTSDVDLVSSPRIITLDNMEAKILIGSSEPYEVFHYDSEGNVTGKEIKFVEVGIKLTVTPKISKDGFIMMTIKPEVSSPRIGTATSSLAVDTTEASASMIVKDGQTLVMGGLIKDNKEKHVAKIPILGDIPLIKYAFRNTYDVVNKKEIIIFITPKIVSPERRYLLGEPASFDVRDEKMLDTLNAQGKADK